MTPIQKIRMSDMGEGNYRKIIASPSKSEEFAQKFTKPMLEDLVRRFGAPIHVLSVACGYGHELMHVQEDKRFRLYGADADQNMLGKAINNLPTASFELLDVQKTRRYPNVRFEAALAINAVIYCPDAMLSFAKNSLRDGGQVLVNFRDGKHPDNEPFFEDCMRNGCPRNVKHVLDMDGHKFDLRVMDYTNREGAISKSGKQMYFQGEDQIRSFIELMRLKVVKKEDFCYYSDEYKGLEAQNRVYVFRLRK